MRSSGNSATIPGSISNMCTKLRNSTATGLSAVSRSLREDARPYDFVRSALDAPNVSSTFPRSPRGPRWSGCQRNSCGTTRSNRARPHRRRGSQSQGSTGRPTPLRCRGDAARRHAPSETPRQKGRQPLQAFRVSGTAPSVTAWAIPAARLRNSEIFCSPRSWLEYGVPVIPG